MLARPRAALAALLSLAVAAAAQGGVEVCRPGFRVAAVTDGSQPDCERCAPGFFSNVSNAPACAPCPLHTQARAAGATSADNCTEDARACARGEVFSADTGACKPCPAGTFKDSAGRAACAACPARSTTHALGGATAAQQCVFCTRNSFWRGGGCAQCPLCQRVAEDRHQRTSCERCPFAAEPAAEDAGQCPMPGLDSPCFAQAAAQDVHACADQVLASAAALTVADLQSDAPAACAAATYLSAACQRAPPSLRLDPSYGLGVPSNRVLAEELQQNTWWRNCVDPTQIQPKANACKMLAPAAGGAAPAHTRFLFVPFGLSSLSPTALQAVEKRNARTADANYGCLVCGGAEVRTASMPPDAAPGMTLFALEAPLPRAVAAKTQFFDIARLGLAYLLRERVAPDYARCMQQTRNTQTAATGDLANELTAQRVCMLPNRRQSLGALTFAPVADVDQGAALRALEQTWLAHFRARDRAESAAWGNLTELAGVALMAVRLRLRPHAPALPLAPPPTLQLVAVRAGFSEHAGAVSGPEWRATLDAAALTATASVDGAWLAAAGASARVRVGVPSDLVESVEVWLCAGQGALLCAQVAAAEPPPPAANATRYYPCDAQEFAARAARLQHGAHFAELRGSVAAEHVCGFRGARAGEARAAQRAAAAAALAAMKDAGHCSVLAVPGGVSPAAM